MKTRYFKLIENDNTYSIYALKRVREKCLYTNTEGYRKNGHDFYKKWKNPIHNYDEGILKMMNKVPGISYLNIIELTKEEAFLEMI